MPTELRGDAAPGLGAFPQGEVDALGKRVMESYPLPRYGSS